MDEHVVHGQLMPTHNPCCNCNCDPTMPRTFEQSAARYNDQAAFNAANMQQQFILQQQVQFQSMMQQVNDNQMARNQAMLRALGIQGQ